MRFLEKEISYKIEGCPIKKKESAIEAFNLLENETILKFYQTNEKEEISVMCENQQKFEGGVFIAGEGGPANIIKSGEFNIILNLSKKSVCFIWQMNCVSSSINIYF